MNRLPYILAALTAATLAGGCAGDSAPTPPPRRMPSTAVTVDIDAAIALAGRDDRPLLLLFTAAPVRAKQVGPYPYTVVDLRSSGNRPVAARYHVADADTPTLVTLTPAGLIVGRDDHAADGPTTAATDRYVATRMKRLDAEYARLRAAVDAVPTDVAARVTLASFLRHRQNNYEAIPHLAFVAHEDTTDVPTRVRAWVDLVRAHQWVGEPEKGRHEAQALIATLGGRSANARAGGNLVLGFQDATAKRFDRARQEFTAAEGAAPRSGYAKEAIVARAMLLPPPTTQR